MDDRDEEARRTIDLLTRMAAEKLEAQRENMPARDYTWRRLADLADALCELAHSDSREQNGFYLAVFAAGIIQHSGKLFPAEVKQQLNAIRGE